MFCGNCGKEVKNGGGRFCPHCGAVLNGGNENLGWKTEPKQGPVYQYHPPVSTEMPMKWYKFVIYFQLFASAVIGFISGISYMLGLQYGDGLGSMVYGFYRGLKSVDIITGLLSWGMAVMAIISRQKLKNFKKDAVTWYLLTLGCNFVLPIFYIVVGSAVTGLNMIAEGGFSITSAIICIAMIILNKVYFDKRKELFVN